MTILPFPEMPKFICYHNKAFPFGIIEANSPNDITRWLCTKSINVVYNSDLDNNKFDLDTWDTWGVWEALMTQQFFYLDKNLISLMNIDLASMIKLFIDNGCYIHGEYNEKYIPAKWAYGKVDYTHDFLIIGYDDDKLYSVGFVADGRFKHFEISFGDFIESITNTSSSIMNIDFFSYNKDAVPGIHINFMLSELEKYISTADCCSNSENSDKSYGLLALKNLKEFFVDEVVNKCRTYIDRRYSRVLYEHEWVFTQVIEEFLNEEEKKEYIDYATQNLNYAKLVHALGLKMEKTGDASLIDRIVLYIDMIIENEKRYVPKLLMLLKAKYSNNILQNN